MTETLPALHQRYKLGTVKISVKQLKRPATTVASAFAPEASALVHLEDIIAVTQDVIFFRREYATWSRQQETLKTGQNAPTQMDKGHQHFIEALTSIFANLRQACDKSKAYKGTRETSVDSRRDSPDSILLTNIFEHLAVEERDDGLVSPEKKSPPQCWCFEDDGRHYGK